MERNDKHLVFSLCGIVFTLIMIYLYLLSPRIAADTPLTKLLLPNDKSVWEYAKLLFWPTVLFMIAEFAFYGFSCKDHLPSAAIAIALGLISYFAAYYTMCGALDFNSKAASLVIATFFTYFCSYISFRSEKLKSKTAIIAGGTLYADLLVMMISFSFVPLNLPLFN